MPKEGWAWPPSSRSRHYILNGVSICGTWLYAGDDVEGVPDDAPDNCPECQKRLKKRKERLGL